MDNRPIGVFDSGVGGLTVVKELKALLPHEDIVYFGDVGRVPYGSRSRETIRLYAQGDINFLLSKNVKMVVAACGTASSVIDADMIEAMPVPYTGVIIPTAKAAAAATLSGKVGIIGTTATVKSCSFAKALTSENSSLQITARDCPLFVPLVENGYTDRYNPITKLVAEEYLSPILSAEVDTLILGCTHYPLLTATIGDVLGTGVTLVDSGRETAKFVSGFLVQNNLLSDRTTAGTRQYYISEQTETFAATAEKFIPNETGITAQYVPLDSL